MSVSAVEIQTASDLQVGPKIPRLFLEFRIIHMYLSPTVAVNPEPPGSS